MPAQRFRVAPLSLAGPVALLPILTVCLTASAFEWVQVQEPPGPSIQGMAAGEVYLFAGSDAGLYRTSLDTPGSWELILDGEVVRDVIVGGPGDSHILVASEGNDLVWRSTDGGETWNRVLAGTSIMQARGFAWTGVFPGRVWTLAVESYAGVLYHSLCTSTDFGATWDCPWWCEDCGAYYIVAGYDRPDRLHMGRIYCHIECWIDNYLSTDFGDTWEPFHPDALDMWSLPGAAVNPADTEQFFMVSSDVHRWEGGVYEYMGNPGILGLEIVVPLWGGGDLFLVGSEWDAFHPQVLVSFDSGESWSPFGTGLPEVEVNPFYNDSVELIAAPSEHRLFFYDRTAELWMLEFDPSSAEDVALVARPLWMSPGHPNPFSTTVRFRLPRGLVDGTVEVLDLAGRRMRRLGVPPGDARVTWDGRLDAGGEAPAGVYFIRVRSGEQTATRRVTLLR